MGVHGLFLYLAARILYTSLSGGRKKKIGCEYAIEENII